MVETEQSHCDSRSRSTRAGSAPSRHEAAALRVAPASFELLARPSRLLGPTLRTSTCLIISIERSELLNLCSTLSMSGPFLGVLQLLPPRDRHRPQADRNEQPHREAVPLWPGLSPLPRPVGLARLSVDNSLPVAAVFLRPEPSEAPPPIPFRFCPVVPPWSPASGVHVTLLHCFAGRTSGSCRSSVRLSWCRIVGPIRQRVNRPYRVLRLAGRPACRPRSCALENEPTPK